MQSPIITLDEETLRGELREVVRSTVEEVVNGILDAQADELADAGKYERTDERRAYRSGHHARGLLTQAGKIEAGVPKLRGSRGSPPRSPSATAGASPASRRRRWRCTCSASRRGTSRR